MAGSFRVVAAYGVAVMNEHVRSVSNTRLQIEVEERRDNPGTWTVEAIGSDGEIYQAFFAGPDAEGRAREYAGFKYAGAA